MNGVRNHSESDSEIYRLSPVDSLSRSSHNFFHTGDHSEIIYLGNEEPDGCSTAEETILVVPNSKKGEVGNSNNMHQEYKSVKINPQLQSGFNNGPGHQMKPSHPKMTSEDNSRAFILNFSGGYTRPTIDSMFDSDDESFSPASSLKTPENEVDDIDPDDIPSILDGLNQQNLPKSSSKIPDVEMENDDSNSNQYDEALTNSFATPTPKKRQRKAAFRKVENRDEQSSRQARLAEALRNREEMLEKSRCTSDDSINPLTRELLVLSGDRHGPFVGRPNIVRPTDSLYDAAFAHSRVETKRWTMPTLSDITLRVPPTTLQISVLDIEPAKFASDFSECENKTHAPSRFSTPVAGEMSRDEVKKRTEQALRRREEKELEKERRLVARREKAERRAAGVTLKSSRTTPHPVETIASVVEAEKPPLSFATPSAPRSRHKKKDSRRPKKLTFSKPSTSDMEASREDFSLNYEAAMMEGNFEEISLALQKNDTRSEEISENLRRFSVPRESHSPVEDIFPEATLESDDEQAERADAPSYESLTYQSMLDFSRDRVIQNIKKRPLHRRKSSKKSATSSNSMQHTTTVTTENKHKQKDLNYNSCVEIVSKRNVISDHDLQEIERVFSMQVDFKPIVSSINRSSKKKSTKLRKLSREAESESFDQKVPDRAAIYPSSSDLSCPPRNSPQSTSPIHKSNSSIVLPTGIPPRRSSLRSNQDS
ncbi:unnamed protein product [Oikopleura dioica]|uniref:Uncharacterized protein n=1 Tax=Oikopleura dioica TaxID=34765 RepID=E4Y801_OIKDI|nr:unnamed protein product [Oikopleura dioica]